MSVAVTVDVTVAVTMAVAVTVAVAVALSHLCLPHTADGGSQPSHITQL